MRLHRLLPPLLALVVLAACGSGSSSEKAEATASPQAAASPEATPKSGCQKVAKPASKDDKLRKPKLELDPKKSYTAVVETSCGTFEIALDVKRAPKTAASFVSLARKDFYESTTFHRIVPGFVIQGGDPLGTGRGGPGYTVVEAPPKSLSYARGVVAMAKAPDEPAGALGSQFFVVTGEDAGLQPQYALLGKVTKGQDVVDTIGTVATDPATESPVEPIVIESVTVEEG